MKPIYPQDKERIRQAMNLIRHVRQDLEAAKQDMPDDIKEICEELQIVEMSLNRVHAKAPLYGYDVPYPVPVPAYPEKKKEEEVASIYQRHFKGPGVYNIHWRKDGQTEFVEKTVKSALELQTVCDNWGKNGYRILKIEPKT